MLKRLASSVRFGMVGNGSKSVCNWHASTPQLATTRLVHGWLVIVLYDAALQPRALGDGGGEAGVSRKGELDNSN